MQDISLEASQALRRSYKVAFELGAKYVAADSLDALQRATNESNELALVPPRPSREAELLDKLLIATLEYLTRTFEDRKERSHG
ncbi:MAG: hypothetical protein IKZ82_05820 [Clostridia bacterium]|nr:hypothetical protein [Clostridia bacterium]